MINGLLKVLKNISDIIWHNNLPINSVKCIISSLFTLAKIDHRLSQLHKDLEN